MEKEIRSAQTKCTEILWGKTGSSIPASLTSPSFSFSIGGKRKRSQMMRRMKPKKLEEPNSFSHRISFSYGQSIVSSMILCWRRLVRRKLAVGEEKKFMAKRISSKQKDNGWKDMLCLQDSFTLAQRFIFPSSFCLAGQCLSSSNPSIFFGEVT